MVLKRILSFWNRYENLNLKVALLLIGLQLIHLYWLTTDIVIPKMFGSAPVFPDMFVPLLILIDYIEIPGLIAGVTFYAVSINRNNGKFRNYLMLFLLVIQVFHIFWITDEVVAETFFNSDIVQIPIYLAWVAILIDYLELPVIGDLFHRLLRKKR